MKATDQIVEKIRKCLALANGMNASQGEMETALAKAKEVAMRHGIDISSISLEDKQNAGPSIEVVNDESLMISSKYEQPYHRWIYNILQQCFGVRVITSVASTYGGRKVFKIYLIGEVVDVEIAKVIFPWLEKIFPRTLSQAVRRGQLTYCAAHTNGCYAGLFQGILAANKREEEKLTGEDKSTWALVVREKKDLIDERVEEEFPDLQTRKSRERQMSSYGYRVGYDAGSQIKLNQLQGAKTSSQIN